MEGEEQEEMDEHHGRKRWHQGLFIFLKSSETKDLGES